MQIKQKIQTIFNEQFRSDTKQITQLSIPYIFSYILEILLMPITSIIFMGWIGQLEFSACVTARILYLLFGYTCHFGLTYACDTLLSQAYGGNKYQMGTIIQRAFLIGINAVVITWIFLINIQYFTPFIERNEQAVRLINKYLSFSIITVPFEAFSILMQKFIINHGVTWPLLFINSIGNTVNILVHYVLLYIFEFSVEAPPIAFSCAYLSMSLLCIVYLYLSSLSEHTWHPWTRDCLQEWWTYLKLGIPGIIISFIQALIYGGATLLSSVFSENVVTAQGVVFYVDYYIFLISFAFGICSTIVIGRSLGAGSYKKVPQIKSTIYIITLIFIIFTIICSLSVLHWIPYLFRTPSSIRFHTRYLSTIIMIFCALEFYHLSQASVLRACGRQYFDALVLFSTYFFLGIPSGIFFIFKLNLNMAGYWFALLLCLLLTNIIFFIDIRKINWKEQVAQAQKNISNKKDTKELTLVVSNNDNTNNLSLLKFIKTKLIIFICLLILFVLSLAFMLGFQK